MNDDNVTALEPARKLAEAIREVKNATADRDDVVIELREAERMRLELLAQELAPIIAEVPQDTDLFDFAISAGLQPRFWIDAATHVSMGRDKRTFRFLKDTRIGRVVLAESTDIKTVANKVTRYLAERIVERQRIIEGDVVTYGRQRARLSDEPAQALVHRAISTDESSTPAGAEAPGPVNGQPAIATPSLSSFFTGLLLAIAGAGVGLAVAAAIFWERLGLAGLLAG